MALLQEAVDRHLEDRAVTPKWVTELLNSLRKELADDAWKLFHEHEEDVLVTIYRKVLFVNVHFTVRVKHARWLVEQIVGPEVVA